MEMIGFVVCVVIGMPAKWLVDNNWTYCYTVIPSEQNPNRVFDEIHGFTLLLFHCCLPN